MFEQSLKKIKEPSQRTFPLSFWFFVSTFVKTISSLKYFKNLELEVLLILKVFNKREPGGSAKLNQSFLNSFKTKKLDEVAEKSPQQQL
jgi:hypothetical protein